MEYIDSCLLTLLCLEGLLASKSALVSVLKTKHEKATCTHLTSQEYDLVEFNTFYTCSQRGMDQTYRDEKYASGHMKSDSIAL